MTANEIHIIANKKRFYGRVINAFRSYSIYMLNNLNVTRQLFNQLPERQKNYLQGYEKQFDDVEKAIMSNQELLNTILKEVGPGLFHFDPMTLQLEDCRPGEVERVQVSMSQVVREWTAVGQNELDAAFNPIVTALLEQFPPKTCDTSKIKVLVPGSGLYRLGQIIGHYGFFVEGNEYSPFMIIWTFFILTKCKKVNEHTIYPWLLQSTNFILAKSQTKELTFPNVSTTIMCGGVPNHFRMTAGNFYELYRKTNDWNCVVTSFFIDADVNIIILIERIYRILKKGGIWINIGPLLYHYSTAPGFLSVEPSFEQLREAILCIGFDILKEQCNIPTPYTNHPESMVQFTFKSVFFVCRKPDEDNK